MPFSDPADRERFLAALRRETRKGQTLQESAQLMIQEFQAELRPAVVLARVYATVPFAHLPEPDRTFAAAVAERNNARDTLDAETRVLSLLGTAGVETAWCDRYLSESHLAIPLLSETFVAGIPMIAGLIGQLGSSREWYRRTAPEAKLSGFGIFTESFLVPDAAITCDSSGRLLIPAQDFVQRYGVRSVVGVGGQYPDDGTILVCIVFTTDSVAEAPPWLARLPLALGTVTQPLVAAGRLYPAQNHRIE